MRAFVTGPNGFLGIHLLQELAKEGSEIVAFHRPTSDISDLRRIPGVTYAVGDVRDLDSVLAGMPMGVDAVFHAAGSVGFLSPEEEKSQYDINELGARNLVSAAFARSARRFIYTSTVLTYDWGRRITEQSPPNTAATYSYIHSKYLAEREVESAIAKGLDVVIIHPSAIFGAYDKATWSQAFHAIYNGRLLAAPPGGASFCHMRKVAEAHVSALHRGRTGEHYVLGGADATFLEVTQEIAKILGRSGPRFALPAPLFRRFGRLEFWLSRMLGRKPVFTPALADIMCETILCDSKKAISELGYQPSSLQTMLMDCYEWMVETKMLPAGTAA
jgi:dihydroflavonol-4-reductase